MSTKASGAFLIGSTLFSASISPWNEWPWSTDGSSLSLRIVAHARRTSWLSSRVTTPILRYASTIAVSSRAASARMNFAYRTRFGIDRYFTWPKSMRPTVPSGATRTLPGCGSQLIHPCSNSCSPWTLTTVSSIFSGSNGSGNSSSLTPAPKHCKNAFPRRVAARASDTTAPEEAMERAARGVGIILNASRLSSCSERRTSRVVLRRVASLPPIARSASTSLTPGRRSMTSIVRVHRGMIGFGTRNVFHRRLLRSFAARARL
mmetsp:Transcript_54890/g.130333  ORF Transcript_54890/g.130333 Transcript_54890/m.130333 type:complete len:262 (-) Transcript_54890:1017-1802(-)